MRKKGDALSKAWETINTPIVAADSAMRDKAEEDQKERKSLLLAVKRNSRERQARHIAKGMPIKSAQSKENTMSRTRGQSKTHTTGSIAREKQATHAHISKLMDDLPKDKPSKGITVTKKTVSMKPVSKTKPVTLCDLKKKAGINLFLKYREKKAAEKRAALWDKLFRSGKLGQKALSKLFAESNDPAISRLFMNPEAIKDLAAGPAILGRRAGRDNAWNHIWQSLRKQFASPGKSTITPISKLKSRAADIRRLRAEAEASARKAKGKIAPSSRRSESTLGTELDPYRQAYGLNSPISSARLANVGAAEDVLGRYKDVTPPQPTIIDIGDRLRPGGVRDPGGDLGQRFKTWAGADKLESKSPLSALKNLFKRSSADLSLEKRAALWDKLFRVGRLNRESVAKLLRRAHKMPEPAPRPLGSLPPHGDEIPFNLTPKDTWEVLREQFASPGKSTITPMTELKRQAKNMRRAKAKSLPSSRKIEARGLQSPKPDFRPLGSFPPHGV